MQECPIKWVVKPRKELREYWHGYWASWNAHKPLYIIDTMLYFSAYALVKERHHEARTLLDSISICRPFTAYQLREAIEGLFKKKVMPGPVHLTSFPSLMNELPQDEYVPRAARLIRQLSTLAQNNIITVGWEHGKKSTCNDAHRRRPAA